MERPGGEVSMMCQRSGSLLKPWGARLERQWPWGLLPPLAGASHREGYQQRRGRGPMLPEGPESHKGHKHPLLLEISPFSQPLSSSNRACLLRGKSPPRRGLRGANQVFLKGSRPNIYISEETPANQALPSATWKPLQMSGQGHTCWGLSTCTHSSSSIQVSSVC